MPRKMSQTLKELIGVTHDTEKEFFTKHPTIGKLEAGREGAKNWNLEEWSVKALEDFEKLFGINPYDINIPLSAGVPIATMISNKEKHPEMSLEDIIEFTESNHHKRLNRQVDSDGEAYPNEKQHLINIFGDMFDGLFEDPDDDSDIGDPHDMLLFRDAEVISASTVMGIMDFMHYDELRASAMCSVMFGSEPGDEITVDYGSVDADFPRMIHDVLPDARHGIVTFNLFDSDEDFVEMSSAFEINKGADTVWFEHAIALLVFEEVLASGANAGIVVRVFNDDETIEVTRPDGKKVTIPRKFVFGWSRTEESRFAGLSAEEMSLAHSTDHSTGDLIVPEEGVDFLSTHDYED